MRIQAVALSAAAATVTAIAFGICGLLFAVAPGLTSAFVSWVLHVDVTTMTRPVSVANLVGGIALFGAYVGTLVGVTAALYNRFTESRIP
jgi:LytS/YehU family sensor histidine kinase